MPGMSSFEAARQIRKARPEIRIIFLSMYDDEDYLAECVELGASGYVLKDSPVDQLLTAIREAHRGGSFLSPRLVARLVDGFRLQGRGPDRERFGRLRSSRSAPSSSRRWIFRLVLPMSRTAVLIAAPRAGARGQRGAAAGRTRRSSCLPDGRCR